MRWTPRVKEAPLYREPFTPDSFIEQTPLRLPPEAQRHLFHYKLAWNNNELEWLMVKNSIWLDNLITVNFLERTYDRNHNPAGL